LAKVKNGRAALRPLKIVEKFKGLATNKCCLLLFANLPKSNAAQRILDHSATKFETSVIGVQQKALPLSKRPVLS
jgi:hypothetical protein